MAVDPPSLNFVFRVAWAVSAMALVVAVTGCGRDPLNTGRLDAVWGRHGLSNGRLQKPRAMAIDAMNRIYIVDKAARLQVFDTEGKLLYGPWKTPDYKNGRPTGLSIDRNGNLLVADTHYYRVLRYKTDGTLIPEQTLGGTSGRGEGEFGLVRDAVQDSHGNLYVAEDGEFDRIQKFSPDGKFLLQWGGHGSEPGQFRRPQNLAVDEKDHIWIADACNHRIQVFDSEGNLVRMWGTQGRGVGELLYPYDLIVTDRHTYVCEFGNHRVQKFTHEGKSLGCFGTAGHGPGQFNHPWAMVRDTRGRLYVLDTNNHRVQRIRM